eukprot:Gb_26197 [translate_table: standard]
MPSWRLETTLNRCAFPITSRTFLIIFQHASFPRPIEVYYVQDAGVTRCCHAAGHRSIAVPKVGLIVANTGLWNSHGPLDARDLDTWGDPEPRTRGRPDTRSAEREGSGPHLEDEWRRTGRKGKGHKMMMRVDTSGKDEAIRSKKRTLTEGKDPRNLDSREDDTRCISRPSQGSLQSYKGKGKGTPRRSTIMTSVLIPRARGPKGHTHTEETKYEEAPGLELAISRQVSFTRCGADSPKS